MKYRGFMVTEDTLASKFLYFCSRLQKDINDKTLDPYPHKAMSQG